MLFLLLLFLDFVFNFQVLGKHVEKSPSCKNYKEDEEDIEVFHFKNSFLGEKLVGLSPQVGNLYAPRKETYFPSSEAKG